MTRLSIRRRRIGESAMDLRNLKSRIRWWTTLGCHSPRIGRPPLVNLKCLRGQRDLTNRSGLDLGFWAGVKGPRVWTSLLTKDGRRTKIGCGAGARATPLTSELKRIGWGTDAIRNPLRTHTNENSESELGVTLRKKRTRGVISHLGAFLKPES